MVVQADVIVIIIAIIIVIIAIIVDAKQTNHTILPANSNAPMLLALQYESDRSIVSP